MSRYERIVRNLCVSACLAAFSVTRLLVVGVNGVCEGKPLAVDRSSPLPCREQ